MCLGFDVQQRGVKPIEYLRQRPILKIQPTVEDVNRLLFSKSIGWNARRSGGAGFESMNATLRRASISIDGFVRLREMIAGPLCNVSETRLRAAINIGQAVQCFRDRRPGIGERL